MKEKAGGREGGREGGRGEEGVWGKRRGSGVYVTPFEGRIEGDMCISVV